MSTPQTRAAKMTAVWGGIVNSLLCVTKLVVGTLTNSTALVADGLHSLTDLVTDVFTYILVGVGRSEADESHPYGHGKFETFGTFTLSAFLFITGLWILGTAVNRLLFAPTPLEMGGYALGVAAVSILANEGLFFYTLRVGKRVKSRLLLANAWHHRSDSLSSVAALMGIGLGILGYPAADAVAAIAVAFLLLRVAWKYGRRAFDELVDASLEEFLLEKIAAHIRKIEGVHGLHLLRGRRLGHRIFLDVHIEVDPYISVSEGHAIADTTEKSLVRTFEEVADVIVHVDPVDRDGAGLPTRSRETLEKTVREAVAETCPGAQISGLFLHILTEELATDIILEAVAPIEKSAKDALIKALTGRNGPFKRVSVSQRL